MYRFVFALALCTALGCGGAPKIEKSALTVSDVPPDIMKIAKEKLPDVTTFTEAYKENGNYELRGKDKRGKLREIDITPDGKVVELD